MGFYRNVDQRMWGDRRFRELSAPAPNAQTLWVYLLTGPHVGPVPGLSCVGRAGLAEALGWEVEDFDRCFAELEQRGMARADWRARVLWLPRALKHNPPESPNHVKGWSLYLDSMPDSPVFDAAREELFEHLKLRGRAFEDALAKHCESPAQRTTESPSEALAQALPKPLRKPSAQRSASPDASPLEAGEGEGKGKKKEEKNPPTPQAAGAPAPAPPPAAPAAKRPRVKRERVLSPTSRAIGELVQRETGVAYPPASFDVLERVLAAGELTHDDALLVAQQAAQDPWLVGTVRLDPTVLFRRERWPGLLAHARAGAAPRVARARAPAAELLVAPPQPVEARVASEFEAWREASTAPEIRALAAPPASEGRALAACVSCGVASLGRWTAATGGPPRFVALPEAQAGECRTHLTASARDELLRLARTPHVQPLAVAALLREVGLTPELLAVARELVSVELPPGRAGALAPVWAMLEQELLPPLRVVR